MEMKLRKLLPFIGALCASFCVVSASAETRYDGPTQSNAMQKSSSAHGHQGQQGTYQRGMYREITPNAGPRVVHGADVFLTADYILWKLVQDGSTWANIKSTGTDCDGATSASSTFKDGNFHWNSGFRVGLGLNLAHDGWDLKAEYTWLRTRSKDSIKAQANTSGTPPTGVFPAFFVQTSETFPSNVLKGFDEGRTRQRTRYNVINLELGRNFYVSQFLMIRPHYGFTGNWQRYRQTTKLDGSFNINGDQTTYNRYVRRDNNKTWGLGIRTGFDTAWHFTTQWSIFGDFALSSIWTCYDLNSTDTAQVVSGTDCNNNENVTTSTVIDSASPSNRYKVKFMGEMQLGLRWEIWFYDDNYHFAVQVGWYENVWVNHMTFLDQNRRDNYYDMNMHGLDVRFRFDF